MSKEISKTPRKPEVWADTTQKIRTVKGEEIEYPKKISIGKDLKVREFLLEKLSPFMDLFLGRDEKDLEDEKGLGEKAFSFFMKEFPPILPFIVSTVIEKDEEWVLENVDKETCEGIVNPFFKSFFSLPQIQEMLPKEILQMSQKELLQASQK